MESRELRVLALGACHALIPRGVCDNVMEVNKHLHATSACFHEAVEEGVRQGAASALAVVHFHFPSLVDVSEVAEGFHGNTRDSNMAFLMPCLEEATDVVLAIAPLEAILYGPSVDHKG